MVHKLGESIFSSYNGQGIATRSNSRRYVGGRWQDKSLEKEKEKQKKDGQTPGDRGHAPRRAEEAVRDQGSSSAGGGEGWHGQECFREVKMRKRRDVPHGQD